MMSRLSRLPATMSINWQMCARRGITTTPKLGSDHGDLYFGPEKAAGRQIVGYGHNAEPTYSDRIDYWYPAMQFKVQDARYAELDKKQQGDWNALTVDEKKELYRYNFRQTRAEFFAPTGYWKTATFLFMYFVSLALGIVWFLHRFILPPPPATFSQEWKEAMLQRMIDLRMEPITGVSSKWDYEKNTWKA